ncbi:hypothetical protein EVAR_6878_1 [Eumeta japonica]|uniref:Uncharacterized protein n=1 Tax=Eumeta variegata TaxID=151549 RepID=A0A4C1THC5_EUMVA|nr:hypothetical protein EVAR_6878_1 [Eumeta japonica]
MSMGRSGTWREYNLYTRPVPYSVEGLSYVKEDSYGFFDFKAPRHILLSGGLVADTNELRETELFVNDKAFSEKVIIETSFKNSRIVWQTAQEAESICNWQGGREVSGLWMPITSASFQ